MKISNNSIVQYHFSLTDDSGALLESSRGTEPSAYLHGAGNILDGLEGAMVGKVKGDKVSVTLTPAQGFGQRREDAMQRVSVKHLRGAKKWKAGMIAQFDGDHGHQQVTIVKMGKFMADVDVNHPYAGKTLVFDIEIVDVRAATDVEIAHRHVHGPGGHHH
ncbi:MAG: FKBP-type peptidyl-prolyl cis-trans isomerase SlyD [Planctomycetota bacterium]|jgi:FKBP-type peptidyl-prolyl cis-trans isomerase SlyD